MPILPYEAGLAPAMTRLYNRAVETAPHCYPISIGEFSETLAATLGQGPLHDLLRDERCLVAQDQDRIVGWVHTGLAGPSEEHPYDHGAIRFLWYERGCRVAGQALLEAAEDGIRRAGMRQVVAYHYDYRYPFYGVRHSYLSARFDHVNALLGLNGYAPYSGEIVLDWPDFALPQPRPLDLPAEITLEWHEGRAARPTLLVHALQAREEVGICVCNSLGEVQAADAAQEWVYVRWLHTAEALRGQGLGRYLLQRALAECHAIGYRHATICTRTDNYRAFLFYANYGFHAVDWAYAWRRELAGE